jgi:hypothetical protein
MMLGFGQNGDINMKRYLYSCLTLVKRLAVTANNACRKQGDTASMAMLLLVMGSAFMCLAIPGAYAKTEASPATITINVAADGDDKADGKTGPVATLHRAQALVLQAVEQLATVPKGKAKRIVVSIAPGTYALQQSLVFDSRYSAPNVKSITWTRSDFSPDTNDRVLADPARQVIISGGRTITGWKAHPQSGSDPSKTNWVQATVSEAAEGTWMFRELWVSGKTTQRSRTKGYFHVNETGKDRRTNFTWNDDDLRPYADLPSVELVFLHDWSITRCPIASLDAATRTLRVPRQIGLDNFFFKIDGFEKHPRYFLENSIEFLDGPGQWQLDYKTGVLTYCLREGETVETLRVVAPGMERLIEVKGTAEKPVKNLSFVGLTLMHAAAPPERENTYWGAQAYFRHSDPHPVTGKPTGTSTPYGALRMEFAHNCRFDYGFVTQMAATGISLRDGCVDCGCLGTVVSDCGGNGIMIGHHNSYPKKAKPGEKAAKDLAAENAVVRRNSLVRCKVTRTGRTFFGAVAVWIGMAQDMVVERCEISHVPYSGISMGWRWDDTPTQARRQTIVNNHIHHCMQRLSDGGGIYSLGFQPGTVLEGNLIHSIPRGAGRAQSNGLFLDEGTKSFLVRDNFIYDIDQGTPIRFHKAKTNDMINNILVVSKNESGEAGAMFGYRGTGPNQIKRVNNVDKVDDIPKAIRQWQKRRDSKGLIWNEDGSLKR